MQSVRELDFSENDSKLQNGYRGRVMYSGESCILIGTKVPAGVEGPDTHTHTSDQIYFVLEGEISIRLGSEVCTAKKNSVIVIPAGVPHHNWNAGSADEVHLEIIAPGGLSMRRPLTESTSSTDARGLPYFIAKADETKFSAVDRMSSDRLVTRERGSQHVHIYLANVPPGVGGPSLHVHQFDQFYFVVEGELNVQVGLDHFVVPPNHLVVLPAGVPHRQWNEGTVPERHVAILAPAPERPNSTEERWDVPVELKLA